MLPTSGVKHTTVTNTADEFVTLWYGHTPYPIGKNETTNLELPPHIVEEIIKGTTVVIGDGSDAPQEDNVSLELNPDVPAENPDPTETPDDPPPPAFDALNAPMEEVRAYAQQIGLILHEDASEETIRDIVYEATLG